MEVTSHSGTIFDTRLTMSSNHVIHVSEGDEAVL